MTEDDVLFGFRLRCLTLAEELGNVRSRPLTLMEIGILEVDDGSHIASDIPASFKILFPAVRHGGWYVIEDLETAYRSSEVEGRMSGRRS